MPKQHDNFSWKLGDPPPEIEDHSKEKLRILESYLSHYFETLNSRPVNPTSKLTLVDGFSGGGQYLDGQTKQTVPGSPLMLLNTVAEAQDRINEKRSLEGGADLSLDVKFIFLDKSKEHIEYLREFLYGQPVARERWDDITIKKGIFTEYVEWICEQIEAHTPRAGRAILILDQFGYTAVPFDLLETLTKRFDNLEIVMTFTVDWLFNYFSDSKQTRTALSKVVEDPETMVQQVLALKYSEPSAWRFRAQQLLYTTLMSRQYSRYFTPFFHIEYGGQFESAAQASQLLLILGAVVVIGIFVLLMMAMSSVRDALLVMLNLPLALIGGVAGVYLAGSVLSIAAIIGFITLFGIATRNGVIMIDYIQTLCRENSALPLIDAVKRGAEERLAPILMTALATGLALVPLAMSLGKPGSEIQAPMALVILCGLVTSTALNMIVVPALYLRFGYAARSQVGDQ